MRKTNRVRRSCVAVWVVLGLPWVGAAQASWEEQDKLLASDGADQDRLGYSVSISGDYAIVGAPESDDTGSEYIFRREGTAWAQQQKLLASDGAAGDRFGWSVSIDGDYAIVGADGNADKGTNSGSAYIFTREGSVWAQQQKLLASDGATGDQFGFSVSISGDYAIVGAFADDDFGNESGSAYVFKRAGTAWVEEWKLLSGGGAAEDCFGCSVSISGDWALVGVVGDDDKGNNSGSACLFTREGTNWYGWTTLRASDGAAGDRFGISVSISGDYAIVGADSDDDKGSAYVFKREGVVWTMSEQKLLASDGAAGDRFGWSVSIGGDYAIVGAEGDDDNGGFSGSAYIYKRDGTAWIQQHKLLASDGAAGDSFGCSVSISGDYAVVGAWADDDNGFWSGSAYTFKTATSPVYRFWSPVKARHFYTISASERDKLVANYSHVWTYEGPVYRAFGQQSDPGLAPVYRFWSTALSAHFYTIHESEKDKLINNYPDVWAYEGPVFYAYPPGVVPLDTAAVYRFWSGTLSCHFYTISETERDKLIASYAHVWTDEGIAWYAYP